MKNQVFSFQRFILIFKLFWIEKGRGILLIASLLACVMFLLMIPLVFVDYYSETLYLLQMLAFFMVVMLGGSLFTSGLLSQYNSTDTGIASIMIPASSFEKFLCVVLLNIIVVVLLTGLYFFLHHSILDFANANIPVSGSKYQYMPQDMRQYFIAMHIVIQGSVLLGSVYFKKLGYVKSIGYLLGVTIVFFVINFGLADWTVLEPSRIVTFPFTSWKIWNVPSWKSYYVEFEGIEQSFVNMIPLLILMTFWLITYFRIKEVEL